MENYELKPCPRCGNVPDINWDVCKARVSCYVRCNSCNIEKRISFDSSDCELDILVCNMNKVAKAWNRQVKKNLTFSTNS